MSGYEQLAFFFGVVFGIAIALIGVWIEKNTD